MKLILASSSPRRRELIKNLALDCDFISPHFDEREPIKSESPENYVIRMSLMKSLSVASRIDEDTLVIGSDTVVVSESNFYLKPANAEIASSMLKSLNNRSHEVYTGICLISFNFKIVITDFESTIVTMRDYSKEEIFQYIESGEYVDKAGSYAIQSKIFNPVQKISGCYNSVVGFPVCKIAKYFDQLNIKIQIKQLSDFQKCTNCKFM